MNRHFPHHRLVRPVELNLAADAAEGTSGRDGKTARQPNQKTMATASGRRTTHALQKADKFMRHEHCCRRR
jgi:hypothetical protein